MLAYVGAGFAVVVAGVVGAGVELAGVLDDGGGIGVAGFVSSGILEEESQAAVTHVTRFFLLFRHGQFVFTHVF